MKKKVFKKQLKDFIKDESGSISQDKVLKIGLGTIAALGIMSAFSPTEAAHSSRSIDDPSSIAHDGCEHGSHSSHSNHSSY